LATLIELSKMVQEPPTTTFWVLFSVTYLRLWDCRACCGRAHSVFTLKVIRQARNMTKQNGPPCRLMIYCATAIVRLQNQIG
jgi:hypothetical protein